MVTIRRLLEEVIDVTHSQPGVRMWRIGPLKHTKARGVASTIKELYREHLNSNLSALRSGMNLNTDGNGNPRPVDLTMTVDEQTNTVIVACTEQTHREIEKLVERLDDAAKNLKKGRMNPLQGVDSALQ
jgi:type II secretory pathway component GspD/PulD (secretin)